MMKVFSNASMMSPLSFSRLDQLDNIDFSFTDEELALSHYVHQGPKDNKNAGWTTKAPKQTGTKRPAGMPKRPMSAYNAFFQRERANIFKEHNGLIGFQELGRQIGKRWKSLKPSERTVYDRIAEKDAIRYNTELNSFEEQRRKRIKSNTTLDPASTKKPDVRGPSSSCVSPSSVTNPLEALAGASPLSNRLLSDSARYQLASLNNGRPLPNGHEVVIPDAQGVTRKYTVTYKTIRMTKKDAEEFLRKHSSG